MISSSCFCFNLCKILISTLSYTAMLLLNPQPSASSQIQRYPDSNKLTHHCCYQALIFCLHLIALPDFRYAHVCIPNNIRRALIQEVPELSSIRGLSMGMNRFTRLPHFDLRSIFVIHAWKFDLTILAGVCVVGILFVYSQGGDGQVSICRYFWHSSGVHVCVRQAPATAIKISTSNS